MFDFLKKKKDAPQERATRNQKDSPTAADAKEKRGSLQTSEMPGSGKVLLMSRLVSEKGGLLRSARKYLFRVAPTANKSEISKFIARYYGVMVRDVHTLRVHARQRGRGKYRNARPGFKKAIVTLAEGQEIKA